MAVLKTWKSFEISAIPALKDNYIYALTNRETKQTCLIDPGDPVPAEKWLSSRDLNLTHILATHHHHDHIGGISSLKNQRQCEVWSSRYDQDRISGSDRGLEDKSEFEILGLKGQALMIPGHTLGHMALYFSAPGWLFPGDTWFGLGCGRIFEGTAEQLKISLDRLKTLPPQTLIFCGHEYTLRNAGFAQQFEPENIQLQRRILHAQKLQHDGQPTVPFTIELELATNPFLRTHSPTLRQALGLSHTATDLEVFCRLRELRNDY